MGNGAIVLCLVGIFCLGTVQLDPIPTYKFLNKSQQREIGLACLDEVELNIVVVETALKTQNFPRQDKKYRDFLACSYKKQGFLSQDGTRILYDNILHFLEQYYDSTDLQTLKSCRLIHRDDPGELCMDTLDCLIDGLRKVESLRSPDIETNQVD